MPNTVNKLPQEDTAKVRQKEELMQLFDFLDERRQRLVLVHIFIGIFALFYFIGQE